MTRLYYHNSGQYGSGVGRVFVGAPYQQGAGIGSFLGGVFRYVLPLLKRSAKAVGKEALQAGVNIMTDVGDRKTPFGEAFKSRMRQSGEKLREKAKDNLDKFMNGEGFKARRRTMPPHLAIALAKYRKEKKRKSKKKPKKKKKKKKKTRTKTVKRLRKKTYKKLQSRRKSCKKPKKMKKQKVEKGTDFVDIFE